MFSINTRLLLAFALCAIVSPSGALARMSADEVVAELQASLALYEDVVLRAQITTTYESEIQTQKESKPNLMFLTYKRFGKQALLSAKRLGKRRGMQNDSILYANGDVLTCQASLDESLKQLEGVNDNLSFILYSKRLAGKQKQDRRSMYNSLADAGVVLWIVGYAQLRDHLRSAEDISMSHQGEITRLEMTSEFGHLKLLFSEQHGWLPEEFELIKEPQHRANRGLVGEMNMRGGGIWPAGKIKQMTWSGNVEEFASEDGLEYPQLIHVTNRVYSEAGPVVTKKTVIQVEHHSFHNELTEQDFQTDIVAPVGHSVTVHNASHLPYRWDGVKAVPEVPDLLVDKTSKGNSEGVNSRTRTWLIGLNVVFLIVLALLFWNKRASAQVR